MVEIDKDIEVPDEENLEELADDTDWKAKAEELQKKHREAGIRNRERTKALKENLAKLESDPRLKAEPEKAKPDEKLLERINKLALRSAQIVDADEEELALNTAKKWGMEIEDVLKDEDFKVKLERLKTSKANALATSNIKGSGNASAKKSKEFWMNQKELPTEQDVPDLKTRADIILSRAKQERGETKQFYNS